MRRRYVVFALLLAGLVFLLSSVIGLAQDGVSGACTELVEQALAEVGNNCDALDRNSACYGFDRVDSTFFEDVPEDFFSAPADRAGLDTVQTLQTAPLDSASGRWGIAVMRVQANIPNTLPGQAVVFLLVGDVELENAVAPEDAVLPAEPVAVVTTVNANLRSGPGTNHNVVDGAPAGTELPADGISPDGEWVRVAFDERPAWISLQVVEPQGDLSGLPEISSETRTPMQSFYFSTGVGDPECNDAPPSALVVQGPRNFTVDITANGADIRLGSTLAFFLLPDNQMQVVVVDGTAVVDGETLPRGFTMIADLDDEGQIDSDSWTTPRVLNDEEIELLMPFENFPEGLFLYRIDVPDATDIANILAALRPVQQPPPPATTEEAPGGSVMTCEGFRQTSPREGYLNGPNTFYWDPAAGATSYQVNVFREDNSLAATSTVPAPNTSTVIDMSTVMIGEGIAFSWEVMAFMDGTVLCTTPRITMNREAPPVCGDGICTPSEAACDPKLPSRCVPICPQDCGPGEAETFEPPG